MITWEQIFGKPDGPVIDTWQKTFHPERAKKIGLDKKTCEGAIAIYGKNHELVRRHCSPPTKPKYRIVFK